MASMKNTPTIIIAIILAIAVGILVTRNPNKPTVVKNTDKIIKNVNKSRPTLFKNFSTFILFTSSNLFFNYKNLTSISISISLNIFCIISLTFPHCNLSNPHPILGIAIYLISFSIQISLTSINALVKDS